MTENSRGPDSLLDRLSKVLDGIDRDEADGGWWETSTGVDFGIRTRDAILDIVHEALDQH